MTNQLLEMTKPIETHLPSVELSVAIGSAVIALGALSVSVWQGVNQRRHDRLSVMPKLTYNYDLAGSIPYRVWLTNVGFGPANISKFTVFVDQVCLEHPTPERLNAELDKFKLPARHMDNFTVQPPDSFAVNQKVCLLGLCRGPNTPVPRELGERLGKLRWMIEYESIYGEKHQLEVKCDVLE